MRIALLEDDRAEAEQFNSALKSWDPTRSAEWFISGQSLLAAADSGDEFTVAFLDIYLPKESGIEVAARLKELSPQTYIISHSLNNFNPDFLPLAPLNATTRALARVAKPAILIMTETFNVEILAYPLKVAFFVSRLSIFINLRTLLRLTIRPLVELEASAKIKKYLILTYFNPILSRFQRKIKSCATAHSKRFLP